MIKHHFYPLCLTSAVLWHSPASHWYFPDTPSQTIWKGFHLVFTLSRLASRLFKVKNAETMFLALNMKSGERQKKKGKNLGEKSPKWAAKHKQCDKTFQYTAKLFPCLFKTNCFHGQQKDPATGCLWVCGLCPQNLSATTPPPPHNPCDISMKSPGWLKATQLTRVSQGMEQPRLGPSLFIKIFQRGHWFGPFLSTQHFHRTPRNVVILRFPHLCQVKRMLANKSLTDRDNAITEAFYS